MRGWRSLASVGLAGLLSAACGGGGADGPDASGRWAGTATYVETGTACEGELGLGMQLTDTDGRITGTLEGDVRRVNSSCQAAVGDNLRGSVTGTRSGDALNLTVDGPIALTGTLSGTSMTGSFAGRFRGLVEVAGRWSLTRQ